jgi:hypothetical protein
MSNYPGPDGRADTQRLTYAELADVRGISRASAERLARRRRWPRQLGNDGIVRVIVPPSEATAEAADTRKRVRGDNLPQTVTPSSADALVRAIAVLEHQLAIANRRIDELIEDRKREAEERRRLLALLTDQRVPRRRWWRWSRQ